MSKEDHMDGSDAFFRAKAESITKSAREYADRRHRAEQERAKAEESDRKVKEAKMEAMRKKNAGKIEPSKASRGAGASPASALQKVEEKTPRGRTPSPVTSVSTRGRSSSSEREL